MLGKVLATCTVLFFFAIFSMGHSSALSTQNIAIGPSITHKNLSAGSVNSGILNISNKGKLGYSYRVYASPYGIQSETYQPVFKKLPGFTDITKWFSFQSTSGSLLPGQTSQLNYKISIPSGTPPGSYYAAVFAQTGPALEQTQNSAQVNVEERVGSLFYINVNGQAYQNGQVNSWSVPFFQSSQIYGNLELKNTGKLYFVSTVNVNFKDILGNIKYQYQTQKIVIPQAIRNIQPVWPKPPIFGLYKVSGTATVYGQKYLTSRYVLIISPGLRLVFIFILVAIIIYLSIQNVLVNVLKGRGHDKK